MVEFSDLIAAEWSIPVPVAAKLCERFAKGESPFYLCDYHADVVAELDTAAVFDIFDTLQEIADLAPKRKRVLNAFRKANVLTPAIENRVKAGTNGAELDDMILPYRPNSRSRGQQAVAKGLGPLADLVEKQEAEDGSLDELAQEYVGKNSSLKTAEDVLNGIRDILAERFAYDETVRTMVRDFGYEDGFFEVAPRNAKDKLFAAYRGKMVPVDQLTLEEYLRLQLAEEQKQVRLKHSVQLFHVNELLRNHFVVNPDCVGFDLICEAIDDCWNRLLQPIVERDVKARIGKAAEKWALREIDKELQERIRDEARNKGALAVEVRQGKEFVVVALGADGQLLGAAREKMQSRDGTFVSTRLGQFRLRYRPGRVFVREGSLADMAEAIVRKAFEDTGGMEITRCDIDRNANGLTSSAWMREHYSDLEGVMNEVYAFGLVALQPLALISEIGLQFFSVHPLQKHVSRERLDLLIRRRITGRKLRKGIPYFEIQDSALSNISCVSKEMLVAIRKHGAHQPFSCKNDLLHVAGMTEVIFRNIAGYVVMPQAEGVLDRTTVHPDHFKWTADMAEELNASVDSLVADPERLRSLVCDDPNDLIFIEKNLISQLRVGQRYASAVAGRRSRRRLRLSEIEENVILPGRVTNITPFGVFVDINAVCDGLIHISQLADGYVETAEQVVKQNDMIDVRVVKVDTDKRRVSLSMKNVGSRTPRIRPSEGQLSNLADHFKNR